MFYITTAIDYANGDPHLGHALEKVGADVIARYRRMRGDTVHFLIGMDEHGQKVAQAAADEGVAPQVLVDRVAERFQAMWERLGISHDQFIRTTSREHIAGVHALIERIFDRNPDDFYEKSYAGRYCVGCEAFKTDSEIADDRCILHPTRTLQWVEERNWFFRLSRYEEFLQQHFATHPHFLGPESRRNEIANTREADHRLGPRTERLGVTPHLGEDVPRCCPSSVSPLRFGSARRESSRVLGRASELDTDRVV